MRKVILRQEAIDDLKEIYFYTYEQWSETQADKYYAAIEADCAAIGANPEIGKSHIYFREGLLGFKSGKHIIVYHKVLNDEIEIIRILHERADLENRLSD